MSEEGLDRSDVVAVLEEVRRERMPEGVAGRGLRGACGADGGTDCSLHDGLVQVVAAVLVVSGWT